MTLKASLAALTVVLLSACSAEAGPAEPEWPVGLYGSVSQSEVTGDIAGFEVRFFEDAGLHKAEFVLCEGGCGASSVADVRRDGEGFVFEHVEQLISTDGPEPHDVRYKVTPVEGGLRLESWYDGEQLPWEGGAPLPPIDKPFGLAVAADQGE
jgi:hypothetical protein